MPRIQPEVRAGRQSPARPRARGAAAPRPEPSRRARREAPRRPRSSTPMRGLVVTGCRVTRIRVIRANQVVAEEREDESSGDVDHVVLIGQHGGQRDQAEPRVRRAPGRRRGCGDRRCRRESSRWRCAATETCCTGRSKPCSTPKIGPVHPAGSGRGKANCSGMIRNTAPATRIAAVIRRRNARSSAAIRAEERRRDEEQIERHVRDDQPRDEREISFPARTTTSPRRARSDVSQLVAP